MHLKTCAQCLGTGSRKLLQLSIFRARVQLENAAARACFAVVTRKPWRLAYHLLLRSMYLIGQLKARGR